MIYGTDSFYGYDTTETRVARIEDIDTVLYLNLGNDLIEEYTPGNLGAVSYIYESDIDCPIARINESTGEILFYHQDVLGNIIALTDNNGVIAESYTYDAFGKVTVRDHTGTVKSKTQVNNPFTFTGREFDWTTELYHYRARTYHPELGRFIQIDPIDFDAKDLNIYRYVGNNPANFTDPWGLMSTDEYRPDPFGYGTNADGSPRDPHIDRINKHGQNVGRYNPDGTSRKNAPAIPKSDIGKLQKAIKRLGKILKKIKHLVVFRYYMFLRNLINILIMKAKIII